MDVNATKMELNDSDNEVLSIYLKEINKVPLLTYKEEYDLAVKAKQGDKEAREKILNSNLRFVVSVAKKFRGQGLPLLDLINEGNVGLITALDKFEPEKGYHFISYAVWWIRQSIMKALSDKGRAVRLPLNRSNELVQIQKAQKSLMDDMSTSDPSVEDISKATGLDESVVKDLLTISSDMVSLDSPVRKKDSDSDSTYGDFVEDSEKGPEDQVMNESMKENVRSLLSVLNDKERRIIELRYGFDGSKPLSLKDIGTQYNLTKERIRQIEKRVLEKLKVAAEQKEIDSYCKAV